VTDIPGDHRYDAVVVGGGPAGLQAALTLGRMHRDVLVLDSGEYRNEPAGHMHNFVTHDGMPPAEFRAAARDDLEAYRTIRLLEVRARTVQPGADGWEASLDDGSTIRARKVLLATGLRDTLPDKPGLTELWGDVVAHCPYCHGHEFSEKVVGILGGGPHVPKLALLMSRIAAQVVVLSDAEAIDESTLALLASAEIGVRPEPVTGLVRSPSGAVASFESGPAIGIGGLFVSPVLSQASPFAQQLGLELLPSGCIRVDEFGRTSRSGVYAAGDLAHLAAFPMPLASVLNAAAAGLLAATALDQDLLTEDFG